MTANAFGRVARRVPRELDRLAIFQEAGVLRPIVIHKHFQSMLLGEVEKPARRHVIDPQAIRVDSFINAKSRSTCSGFGRCHPPNRA